MPILIELLSTLKLEVYNSVQLRFVQILYLQNRCIWRATLELTLYCYRLITSSGCELLKQLIAQL